MAAQAKAPVSRKRALSAEPPLSFEACVVTYISQDRAFQRVFAESDIEGMKNVVREKLNLAPTTGVRLAQVAEGRRIDLEDDADFYAFQLGARFKAELQVEVLIIATPAAQLASPSVTATSINLERAPPPLTQTRKVETPQTVDGSTSGPPTVKKKKSRKSNLVIMDDVEQGSSKPLEQVEPTTDEQAPKVSKSKAQAADPTPPTTSTELVKKPKSKAKSVPPSDQKASSTLEVSKQPHDPVAEVPSAQPKSKKGKKASATITPAPEITPAATTELIPETPPDTEIPRPKKRGRKTAQDVEQQEPIAPETTGAIEPPAKKQRKSKADVVDASKSQSPVATTLPPPVRSERRSSTVLSLPDPDKPVSSVGSAADILRRWGVLSAATETASGSGVGPSTAVDAVDQSTETKTKPKRKRKKKDQAADDTSTTTSVPAPAPSPAETNQCLVCSSGPHESLECPILSKRDSETAKIVEGRIQTLEDAQGPARIHQMLIGGLRRWLKDVKKPAEAQNISVTSRAAPAVQKSASPVHSTPIPTRPKKSKLSSVAVSHQSEGSSTEDEDILKSVMESRIESTEEDDGEDEDMDNAPEFEPAHVPELPKEMASPSTPTPTPTPSPKPALAPLPPSSSPTTKTLLQSQRMSQSSLRALLDGLESEEAGDGDSGSSDEEGSDLAQSTPSEIARRRHRKSVRLDVEDSDEEAAARAQTQVQVQDEDGDGGDSDVEMRDAGERELTTLSQLLDSSQHIPEEIVGVVDEEKDEDDIEEYDDEQEDNEAPDGDTGSPIETPDQEPVGAEDEAAESDEEEEPEPEQEPEPVAPAPKKRGRPPLPQSVKDERAAEKARIQAERAAAQGADPSAPRKRGRPPKQKPAEEGADTSAVSVGGSQGAGPRLRGRPRLSDAVKAERQQEKERIRAEKAIQKLERKTAKAAAKGKGVNTSTPVDGANDEDEDEEDEDATVRQPFHAPEETTESPVAPTWSTLKHPSSSRPGSSQADEIEWSATEAGEDGNGKRPSGSQPAAKPTPGPQRRNGSAPAKPLFMPSSGLGPRFLPPMSPLTSTPAPGKLLSLSEQTPSNVLQRRKSIGAESLPRFTNIRKKHDDQQRSRKERNKLLSSQPTTLDSSQQAKPKPNGVNEEIVTIESSDGEDSSADEANKPKPQSQRKRPSAFAYFAQS